MTDRIDSKINIAVPGGNQVSLRAGIGAPSYGGQEGDLYLRTDGGSGLCLYVKETTSTAATGWSAVTTLTSLTAAIAAITALPSYTPPAPAIFDTFAGADASVLAAKNWTVAVTGGGAADINLQRARSVTSAVGSFGDYVAIESKLANLADVEVLGKYEFAAMNAERYFYIALRANQANFYGGGTGVGLRFGNTTGGVATVQVERVLAGAATFVYTSANFNPTAGDTYMFRFRAQGTTFSLKFWASSLPEPSAWTAQFAETSITAAGLTEFVTRSGAAAAATTSYLHWAQVTAL